MEVILFSYSVKPRLFADAEFLVYKVSIRVAGGNQFKINLFLEVMGAVSTYQLYIDR